MEEKEITITLSVDHAKQLANAAEAGMTKVYVSRYTLTKIIEDIRAKAKVANEAP